MHSTVIDSHVAPVRQSDTLRRVTGVQFVADLAGCRCPRLLLEQSVSLEAACLLAVQESGLTTVGTRFHQFEPGGATGVVLLAESHLAIHTWPEHHFVSVDLYVCNFSEDNTGKAERLLASLQQLFQAQAPASRRIRRGTIDP